MTTYIGPHFHAEEYPKFLDGFPDSGYPRVPGGVVELRVHGVSGGTPEQNLGDPHPIKINGDDEAGVYRRRQSVNSGPERTVEAYNWSSINSGRTMRAFWLALFPFAAANFAGWLLPDGMPDPREDSDRNPSRWRVVVDFFVNRLVAQTCVRALSLVVTAIAMLGMAAITVDIIGLQCGVKDACGEPWWFTWFAPVREWSVLNGYPTRFAIFGTLVPLIALGILWRLGKSSTKYERFGARTNEIDTPDPAGPYVDTIRIDSVGFWQSPDTVYIQGWLHTSVALATLAAMLAGTMRVLAPTSPHHETFLLLLWASIVWLFLIAFLVLMVARMKQIPRSWLRRSDASWWKPRRTWVAAGVPGALLAGIAFLGWGAKGGMPVGSWLIEPIRNGLIVATVTGLALLVVLSLLVGALRILLLIGGVGMWWYAVLVTEAGLVGGPKPFTIPVDLPWLWVGAEAVVAGLMLAWMWWRSTKTYANDPTHRHGLIWIMASAGVVSGIAMGADVRSGPFSWWVFGTAAVIVVAYVLAAFSIRVGIGRKHPDLDAPEHGTMRSGTAFIMAAIALGSILAISASVAVWTARALGDAVAYSGDVVVGSAQIAYAAEAGWFALAAFAGLASLLIVVGLRLLALRLFRWTKDVAGAVCKEYDNATAPPESNNPEGCVGDHSGWRLRFARRSTRLRLFANIVDDVDWIVTSAVMVTYAVLVASVIARSRDGQPGGHVVGAINVAAWVLAGLAVAVFFLIRSARDDRQVRATVGILWDVMNYFPRRFHPLAPPCYSERTVIEVRNRIIEYTKAHDPKGKLLLAHSQGSIIAVAALLSLRTSDSEITPPSRVTPNGTELDDLVFVTYGCMLERLFRRAWPDQLRRSDLVDLKRRLDEIENWEKAFEYPPAGTTPKWMNFGRYTDYLGGRMFTAPQIKPRPTASAPATDDRTDDIMFADPTRRWRFTGERRSARSWLHSFNYESDAEDPRFRKYVWERAAAFGGADENLVED